MSKYNLQRAGENAFQRIDKVNSELLSVTYGSFVTQLVKDLEHASAVNEQLDKIGYNIGIRIIDEFLAKSPVPLCEDFVESGDVLAKVAVKMFLGVNAEAIHWNAEKTAFTLSLQENPLTDFVELPPHYVSLHYSNILCGIIRGAFEQIRLKVACTFEKDGLKGDEGTHIRVQLISILKDIIEDEI